MRREGVRTWRGVVRISILAILGVAMLGASGFAGMMHSTGAASGSFSPVRVSHDVEIVGVQVGEFRHDDKTNTMRFYPTTTFDRASSNHFGWRIDVRASTRRELAIEEVLALPSAPLRWGISDNVKISADRRRATTLLSASPDASHHIQNFWMFSPGDPSGPHFFELHVEGKFVTRLEFEVD